MAKSLQGNDVQPPNDARLPPRYQSNPMVNPRELPAYLPTPSEIEDDNVSIRTRTDDDPVRDAFSCVIDREEDGIDLDDEQILWQPKYAYFSFLIV